MKTVWQNCEPMIDKSFSKVIMLSVVKLSVFEQNVAAPNLKILLQKNVVQTGHTLWLRGHTRVLTLGTIKPFIKLPFLRDKL